MNGPESQGEQRVSGQDRHCLTVFDMARGPTATKIIVVDGGKVVVDERERMHHLDGTRRIQDFVCRSANRFGGGHT